MPFDGSDPSQLAMINDAARQVILKGGRVGGVLQPSAVDMWQPLNPVLPSGFGLGSTINIPLRNIGLVKRLLVYLKVTVTAGATSIQQLTPYGLANLVSNVTFSDLGNNQRISTTGWHLVAISTAKRKFPWGAARMTDTPFGYGNNFAVEKAATQIPQAGTSVCTLILEVPLSYSDTDLRGAIWADTTQSQMQLSITVNPNAFVASTADPTSAVYISAGADLATAGTWSLQVYQNFLDQLPRDLKSGNPVLPPMDLATAYLLANTAAGPPTANQEFPIPFVNNRQFQSLMVIYDNAAVLNVGSDIDHFTLAAANLTAIRRLDPFVASFMARNIIGDDMPKGGYYFDFRDRPVDTNVYGNMQILIQPSSVGGVSSTFLLGWESMGLIGQVAQGGSLYAS